MSNKEEVSVWVIKNKSTGEYLYGDENFVDDFSKASKWKRSSSAVEKLYYLGKRGYEWYPEWAEKADDEDTKENYWRKAKECTELFNNCVIDLLDVCSVQHFSLSLLFKNLMSKI